MRLRYPARAAQDFLYSKLKKFDYFDPSWYRLAYQDEIEFPDDLLWDYVKAGIQNGRDPSPYFNTILYLRENEVPPERALLHYLKGGEQVTAGAYRDAAALLRAQQAFHQATATVMVSDDRTTTRPFTVFLQCGQGSVWDGWTPAPERGWDLLVNHYDSTLAGRLPAGRAAPGRQVPGHRSPRFTACSRITPAIDKYAYIRCWMMTSGLRMATSTACFHRSARGWDMARASLSQTRPARSVFINPESLAGGW
jgi:hypothetical protein